MDNIIIGKNSFNDSDPYAAIQSNISVVNVLRNHDLFLEEMHPAQAGSYFLDYYHAQCRNGGFAQFVWNSSWETDMIEGIHQTLKDIGAKQHLDYFEKRMEVVNGLPDGALDSFLEEDYFSDSDTKEKLHDDSFYAIEEDLITLHSNWIKNHPDLIVAETKDEMYALMEKMVGPIER
ncbi:DUF4375 domain-containing protein [uncultured Flavobacterium sp.]|uniref:DMP19 family protein n=1 Tax=uncultured Flavobacterium sp. TaxID=165435 RepID=UPI0025D76E08|nr:DUF4375 domain-containing protein [uncultured Flavobacterium sp.]